MRVLHLIRSVDPRSGGPVEAVVRSGLEHANMGWVVEVATLDAPDNEFLEQIPLRTHSFGPAFLNYGYSSALVPWLRKHGASYDIVVVNGLWQFHGVAVRRALRGSPVPY